MHVTFKKFLLSLESLLLKVGTKESTACKITEGDIILFVCMSLTPGSIALQRRRGGNSIAMHGKKTAINYEVMVKPRTIYATREKQERKYVNEERGKSWVQTAKFIVKS